VTLSIGELARRLRITPRTLRHYEDVGLLRPEAVDPRTGYRAYGPRQLALGIQIEQLKAAGLSLAAIRAVVDGEDRPETALRQRRDEVTALLADHRRQLATIDAILAARSRLAQPEVVRIGAVHAVTVRVTCDADALGPTIRRTVQRLRRRVRGGDGSFSARFPLEVGDDPVAVDVAAHLAAAAPGSAKLAAERRISVELAGPVTLLPLAYDALLETARQRGLDLGDTAVEHYLDLGAVGRTEIAIPIRGRAGAAEGEGT
jgi:DNA-binding transcriptional MerR regulator